MNKKLSKTVEGKNGEGGSVAKPMDLYQDFNQLCYVWIYECFL